MHLTTFYQQYSGGGMPMVGEYSRIQKLKVNINSELLEV